MGATPTQAIPDAKGASLEVKALLKRGETDLTDLTLKLTEVTDQIKDDKGNPKPYTHNVWQDSDGRRYDVIEVKRNLAGEGEAENVVSTFAAFPICRTFADATKLFGSESAIIQALNEDSKRSVYTPVYQSLKVPTLSEAVDSVAKRFVANAKKFGNVLTLEQAREMVKSQPALMAMFAKK